MTFNRDYEAGRRRRQAQHLGLDRLASCTRAPSLALADARARNLAAAQRAEAERRKARTR